MLVMCSSELKLKHNEAGEMWMGEPIVNLGTGSFAWDSSRAELFLWLHVHYYIPLQGGGCY